MQYPQKGWIENNLSDLAIISRVHATQYLTLSVGVSVGQSRHGLVQTLSYGVRRKAGEGGGRDRLRKKRFFEINSEEERLGC